MRGTRVRMATVLVLLGATTLTGEQVAGARSSGVRSPECPGATVVGTAEDDVLRGTDGADVIDGLGGNDRILGLGGDDVLCGGEGQDRLLGGEGDDTLLGGRDAKVAEDTEYYVYYGDNLDGGPGDDELDPGSDPRHEGTVDTVSYQRADAAITADLQAGTVTGDGTDSLTGPVQKLVGSPHDDTLVGSDDPDVLVGSGGHDRLVGRDGRDLLAGGAWGAGTEDRVGNELVGGSGNDELHGSKGDDVARGGSGDDFVQAEGGRDRAWGGAGDDSFNDLVVPGRGQELHGGPGRDRLSAFGFANARGQESARGRGTTDLRRGRTDAVLPTFTISLVTDGFEDVSTPRADRWTVLGTAGPNELMAGFDHTAVRLFGRAGNDRLFGAFEDDVLDGGAGRDAGTGYVGHDRIRSVEKIYR